MCSKMGGGQIGNPKIGGSVDEVAEKWGEDTFSAEGRADLRTPPPSGYFWQLP